MDKRERYAVRAAAFFAFSVVVWFSYRATGWFELRALLRGRTTASLVEVRIDGQQRHVVIKDPASLAALSDAMFHAVYEGRDGGALYEVTFYFADGRVAHGHLEPFEDVWGVNVMVSLAWDLDPVNFEVVIANPPAELRNAIARLRRQPPANATRP
jgi:hypothetical protein